MDLTRFYAQFQEETTENVRILGDGLLALERASNQESADTRVQVDEIFRAVHTIKGSARLLGFEMIGKLAHAMEDVLGAARDGQCTLERALIDELLRDSDVLLEMAAAAVDGKQTDINVEERITAIRTLQAAAPTHTSAEQASPAPPEAPPQPATSIPTPPPVEPAAPAVPEARPAPEPAQPAAAPRSRATDQQTIRVRVDRLDRLINLTGELVVGQQMIATHAQALEELLPMVQSQETEMLALEAELRDMQLPSDTCELLERHINVLLNTSDEIRQLLRKQSDQFGQHADHQAILVSDLEQEVMSARLMPISEAFAKLPRAVRELTNATNKEVELHILGETTELDRKMIEALSDPLMHMVRNSIDHGIEPPDERLALGKPGQGHLLISAEAVGDEVHVKVKDDGRGIEPDRIRQSAVQKGLVSSQHATMLTDQEALELVFLPGFSTASLITDVSGRGVGMDVVRTNIIELGGQVSLNSAPGQWTEITMILPLTLVTTRVLLMLVERQTFALPALGCRGIIWVAPEHIHTIEGRATIHHEGRTIPLLRMADVMRLETEGAFQNGKRAPALLVGNDQRLLSFLVDRVLDEREAVVKPLGQLLELQRFYTGAIQLGDGQLVLLINPMALVQAARGIGTTLVAPTSISTTPYRKQFNLLLAEDSFTTRELIRSILSSAGYNVTGAADGADALDKLRTRSYDLVITDVEMPRVNGFELTSRIREELGIHDMPVIIITSLASDEHRRRGLEVGAQAYIVKSQFNQDNLLEVLQQLLDSA